MTSEWILHVLKTWAHSLLHSTALGHLNTFFLINQSWPKMLLWVGEVGWEIVETESMPSWRQLLSVFSRSKSPMCSLVHFTPLPINLEKMNFNKVIDYLNLIILTNKKQSISTTGVLAGSASMHRPKGISECFNCKTSSKTTPNRRFYCCQWACYETSI
jgi:hypothetical protein